MFDEYFKPLSVETPVPSAPAVPVSSAGTPSSTIIDQDVPSPSHSPSSSEVQPPILHQGVAVGPTFEDNPFAQADNNPFVNVFAPEPSYEESSSGDLVPPLDCAMIIALKWINIVKLDEYGDVLKNKARSSYTRLSSEEGSLWLEVGSMGVIYVDDIIFASTDPKSCDTFSNEMSSKF
ncbi:hypothetical protein Tco_0931852 [Tanacetum coccineum]